MSHENRQHYEEQAKGSSVLHAAPVDCSPPAARRAGLPWDSLENRRTVAAILAMIVVGGVVLRMYGMYGRSMWFDESISWRIIQFPLGEIIQRIALDIHVPLFFLLLRAWAAVFGESIIALRSFSLAFSAVAMLGVYLLTVEAMAMAHERPHPVPLSQRARGDGDCARSRWTGLVATALFAVSLFQVHSAWQIRMYSLGTALAMFSSWLLVRAVTARPARGLPWMLYMLVALLFAYTHYAALFSLAAQFLFALIYLSMARDGASVERGAERTRERESGRAGERMNQLISPSAHRPISLPFLAPCLPALSLCPACARSSATQGSAGSLRPMPVWRRACCRGCLSAWSRDGGSPANGSEARFR
jgi:hypothetical protein